MVNQRDPLFIPQSVQVPQQQPQEPVEEQPEESKPWQWIGDDRRPEAAEHSDGISDLFEAENDPDTDDLVSVDIERDIIDSDDDGSLDSLTAVSEEDIMGDDMGQTALDAFNGVNQKPPSRRAAPRRSIRPRYTPPPSAGGMRG